VTDEADWAHVSDAARPDDPVLAAACDHITARARQRLREMTLATIPPILARHKAIQAYHDEVRRWV
jgi:hypothetical protein